MGKAAGVVMFGKGGTPPRPVNAPDGYAASGGVQPGQSTGIVVARRVVIFGPNDGVLVYSGSPAVGDLLASILSSAGTDGLGNATLQSIASYDVVGAPRTAGRITGGSFSVYTAATEAGPWAVQGSLFWNTVTSSFEITGNGSPIAVFGQLNSANAPAVQKFGNAIALAAQAAPAAIAGFGIIYATSAGTLALVLPSGLAGTLPVTQSDTATLTNANLVPITAISKQWTIPANDAQVGTKYEIVLPWQATMEATNTLQLGTGLNGAVFTNAVTISAAIVGAGVGIRGTIRAWIKIKTTGAGGTADFFFDGTVQQTGASVTFANSGSIPTQPALAVAINTTVANTLQINSQWGGSTAGQTVSGFDSDFIRSGP